eukprot:Clim_evm3s52 gene=Clim_evmTU3s52
MKFICESLLMLAAISSVLDVIHAMPVKVRRQETDVHVVGAESVVVDVGSTARIGMRRSSDADILVISGADAGAGVFGIAGPASIPTEPAAIAAGQEGDPALAALAAAPARKALRRETPRTPVAINGGDAGAVGAGIFGIAGPASVPTEPAATAAGQEGDPALAALAAAPARKVLRRETRGKPAAINGGDITAPAGIPVPAGP